MKDFARLVNEIDSTTSTLRKIEALVAYFKSASELDAVWAVALLSGNRPKRLVSSTLLRQWVAEFTGHPLWLVEESYSVVGDLGETLSLLCDKSQAFEEREDVSLQHLIESEIVPLQKANDDEKKNWVTQKWRSLSGQEIFVLNKIIMGGFRIGVSRKIVIKALAKWVGVEEAEMEYRFSGKLQPTQDQYIALTAKETTKASPSKLYPFYLAYALDKPLEDLGKVSEWQCEWKWDGIRGQVIKREGEVFIWSRGEEIVTESFPELRESASHLPDGTVLDGEILVTQKQDPQVVRSFNDLQKRLGRKKVSKKLLDSHPISFYTYDLLEIDGVDLRERPLSERRKSLEGVISGTAQSNILISQTVEASSWQGLEDIRENSRKNRAEGLMLKRKDSSYRSGRKKGDWWKWKVAPYTIDTVLIHAQAGHGRRANLYTDYTLAVWKSDSELVPIAKAYSGLTDDEIRELDRWIKAHTKEKYGPVRSVEAHQVLEIAFEGIAPSNRHKSGFSLRFPRIHRWRKDKPALEADRLQSVEQLWKVYEGYS